MNPFVHTGDLHGLSKECRVSVLQGVKLISVHFGKEPQGRDLRGGVLLLVLPWDHAA